MCDARYADDREDGAPRSNSRTTRPATLKQGRHFVSDGREEREERGRRIEKEKREDREDRVNREDPDEWKPERVDS
jgi:hypothetical protein